MERSERHGMLKFCPGVLQARGGLWSPSACHGVRGRTGSSACVGAPRSTRECRCEPSRLPHLLSDHPSVHTLPWSVTAPAQTSRLARLIMSLLNRSPCGGGHTVNPVNPKQSCGRFGTNNHPGGNPGANGWFLQSTPIQTPPESGGICGRLT